jgi:hypothetical protein
MLHDTKNRNKARKSLIRTHCTESEYLKEQINYGHNIKNLRSISLRAGNNNSIINARFDGTAGETIHFLKKLI